MSNDNDDDKGQNSQPLDTVASTSTSNETSTSKTPTNRKTTKSANKTKNNDDKNINDETPSTCESCATKISDQSSMISLMCRICYDDTVDEPIISPCECKGSVGMVHKSCLERWLAESNTSKCDLCQHKFETERTTKFSVQQSCCKWFRYTPANFAFPIRDMRSDMITCFILIPFSIMLIYVCLFAADYYTRDQFSLIPVARWTLISIMFMGIILILGFCTWIFLVLRYHSRVWYFWWQRETVVRIYIQNNETF